jgi:hypothetical protein
VNIRPGTQITKYDNLLEPVCPKEFPHFDVVTLVAFFRLASVAEHVSGEASPIVQDLETMLVAHCGSEWLKTYWGTVNTKHPTLKSWAVSSGFVPPDSFLEFTVHFGLIWFVTEAITRSKLQHTKELSRPLLLYYATTSNARFCYFSDSGPGSSFDLEPRLWQDLAKFLLDNGCDANGTVSLRVDNDSGHLMGALRGRYGNGISFSPPDTPFSASFVQAGPSSDVSDTDRDSTVSRISQHYEADYASSKLPSDIRQQDEGMHSDQSLAKDDNLGSMAAEEVASAASKNPKRANDETSVTPSPAPRSVSAAPEKPISRFEVVTVLHFALAAACTKTDIKPSDQADRIHMLRILVEGGGDACVSNYRNHWSPRPGEAEERSALHYLLFGDPVSARDDVNHQGESPGMSIFDEPEVASALTQCISTFFDRGADPNAVDSDGTTVFECAVPICPPALVELMLEKGAKITPRLLTESGAPVADADGILNKPRWRKPEHYNPEARRLAQKHNPDWPMQQEDRNDGGGRAGILSNATAVLLRGLGRLGITTAGSG